MVDTLVVLITPILLLALAGILLRFVGCTAAQFSAAPSSSPVVAVNLVLSPNPSVVDKPVTFTATVTSDGSAVSGGSVQFGERTADNNLTSLASAPPDPPSGKATATFVFKTTGQHKIEAHYVDDQGHDQGSTFQTQQVDPAVARAPIAFVQAAPGTTEKLNSISVSTAPFPASISAGNLIVVWIYWNSPPPLQAVASVTDAVGNSYLPALGPTAGLGGVAGFQQQIWVAKNITPGANVSVKANFATAFNGEKDIAAFEYSGADQAAPVDKTGAATGNTQNAVVGPVTTTAPGIVFAAAIFGTTGLPGPGFTQRSDLARNVAEDESSPAAGPVKATFNNDPLVDWIAQLVAIK